MLIEGLEHVFGTFDAAMLEQVLPQVEWVHLDAGEVLLRQGSQDESLYFVISGRLRASSADAEGAHTVLGDIARGETVGEMAFFTGEARTATVAAVRDSVLASFSREVFREMLLAYPLISLNMARLLIDRLKRASNGRREISRPVTIGVAAITAGVQAAAFADRLHAALSPYGRCAIVTSDWVDRRFGEEGSASVPMHDGERSRRLARLLEQVESDHQFVLLVADAQATGWSSRCLRHCDEVLLLADADQPDMLHPLERRSLEARSVERGRVNRTLVLLHPDERLSPRQTRRWFAGREIDRHIHVRRGLQRDWERLGRVLSGNAVGLVLSGGGARGFAHLGVLRALEEAGVEFDLVGGTSIGAVMGAYAAMDMPAGEAIGQARRAFRANPTGDYNLLPLLSLIGGARLKSVIDRAVVASRGEHIDIEDLWKGYFCVSSNYSTASEAVLTRGPLARSIRASVSIPGALPPVMVDGDLHIDGGTFNNFPTDVMRRMGAARVIGVNLLRDRSQKYDFDEVPGVLALLRDRFRRRKALRLPSITSLLLNTSMMHSYARQKEAQALADVYIAPQVHRFGMLEWGAFDRIVQAGHEQGRAQLALAGIHSGDNAATQHAGRAGQTEEPHALHALDPRTPRPAAHAQPG
ncbi:MAG: cyclic nucleotide-binding domain-containing protein [Comamonadaceae bacterium]|nr:MAG: cyclic nucleotide-binding domain-containing protein [Comamonadaceae bacterium]